MLRPRVELNTTGDMVHLVCDQNGGHAHEMDADEAWDLGDDLVTGALDIMDKQGKLQWVPSGPPEWGQKVSVTSHHNLGLTMLVCEDCGVLANLGPYGEPVSKVSDMAREHWRLMHSDVAEDAEGEDGQAHADPAVEEAGGEAEAVGDTHDRGDEVKDRGQHGA